MLNIFSAAASIFLSIPVMIASPMRMNMIPRTLLNHHFSSAILRNLAIIDRPQIAMIVSMSESPIA